MGNRLLNTPTEILEEIQKLIGNQTLRVYAPVDTPDGQRVLVIWHRTLPDGTESGERALMGMDLDNALRRVLAYEDDIQDLLQPERVAERNRRMAENKE